MKHALAIGLVMASVVGARANAQTLSVRPGATVAYVSGQRITAESVAGRAAQSRLAALRQQRAAELQEKQRTLQQTRERLAGSIADAERAELRQQENEQRVDLERATAQAQVELQNLQRQITADLQPQVRSALDDLLQGTDVQVVLQFETAIVWAAQGLDLTSAVIERMDAKSAADATSSRNPEPAW